MSSLLKRKHLLASATKSGGGPFNGLVSTANLISYWKLNEISGNRLDSFGTNHLTADITVTAPTGKIGNAAGFTGAQVLRCASNPSLQIGNIEFTFTCWIYTTASGGWVFGKNNVPTSTDYHLELSGTAPVFRINGGQFASNPTALTLNTWNFIVIWRDLAGTGYMRVNNGTVNTTPGGPVPIPGSADFTIGGLQQTYFFNGNVDELAFFKRILLPAEQVSMWNSGNGLTL